MKCVKCYQDIQDGSKFCPYCGAEQTVNPQPAENVQSEPTAQPAQNVQPEPAAQPVENVQPEPTVQPAQNVQPEPTVQPAQNIQPEPAAQPTQNVQPEAGAQNVYQNNVYQTPPVNQSQDQGTPINHVPYLVLSIFSTLCCCLPFGIVGIVFSAKINNAVSAGNMEEARRNAKTAKIWIIAAIACGFVAELIYLAINMSTGNSMYYYY